MKWKTVLITVLFSLSAEARDLLTITVTDYGWIESFPILKPILDNYVEQVQADLNSDPYIKDPKRLMEGTANSVAISSRGVGTDRASEMEKFSIGVSAGAGADFEEDVALKDQVSGLGGAGGFVLGYKYNKKTDLYVNIGGLNHTRTFQGILGTDLVAEITTVNIGTHLRYELVKGSGDSLWGWGGVKGHIGYEYNQNEIVLEDNLNEELSLDVGGVGTVEGRIKGRPHYEIHTQIHSIPIEVSSSISFLKMFNLYGGAGLDLNYGKAKGQGDVKAKVFSPLTCVSGACTNLNLPELEVQGHLDDEKKVDPFTFRGFGGLQLNFWNVKVFGEVNKSLGNKVLGVTLGVRAVF